MTPTQKRGLARLLLRWPERRAQLRQVVPNDVHLCDLCAAYDEACTAAEYWGRSTATIGADRQREYADLTEMMEDDILRGL